MPNLQGKGPNRDGLVARAEAGRRALAAAGAAGRAKMERGKVRVSFEGEGAGDAGQGRGVRALVGRGMARTEDWHGQKGGFWVWAVWDFCLARHFGLFTHQYDISIDYVGV